METMAAETAWSEDRDVSAETGSGLSITAPIDASGGRSCN